MTRDPLDLDRIAALAEDVEALPPAEGLEVMRKAVLSHGGRWDLPGDRPGVYEPAIVSLQVHGVFAMAEDIEALPTNWCRAARNTLEGCDGEQTA